MVQGSISGKEAENTVGLTYLRGMQPSDSNGIVQALTKFPGYYSGRAQHVYVKAHVNGTVTSNNTFVGGSVVHTGQLFFAHSTLDMVHTFYPYTEDLNTFNPNTGQYLKPSIVQFEQSDIFLADQVVQGQANASYYNALVETRSLGVNVSAGLIGFINIAIDPVTVPAAVGGGGDTSNGAMQSGGFSSSGSPSREMPNGAAWVITPHQLHLSEVNVIRGKTGRVRVKSSCFCLS